MRSNAREFSTPAGALETGPDASQAADFGFLLHEDPLALAALHLSPPGLDQVEVYGNSFRDTVLGVGSLYSQLSAPQV